MRTMMLGALLLLGACGFHPMMGADTRNADVSEMMNAVEIAEIKDRPGQMMRNLLIDHFYHDKKSTTPLYRLDVALETGLHNLSIEKDSSVSSGLATVSATFRLVHIASGGIVFKGTSIANPTYNISHYQWASEVSLDSAVQRGIESISDDISRRIALFFNRDEPLNH